MIEVVPRSPVTILTSEIVTRNCFLFLFQVSIQSARLLNVECEASREPVGALVAKTQGFFMSWG
jgi:hypothetical protein